jgi:hypothetical protein
MAEPITMPGCAYPSPRLAAAFGYIDGMQPVTDINAGQPPAWLHRLADAGPGGYVLYGLAP